jgi:hypothetical protein
MSVNSNPTASQIYEKTSNLKKLSFIAGVDGTSSDNLHFRTFQQIVIKLYDIHGPGETDS